MEDYTHNLLMKRLILLCTFATLCFHVSFAQEQQTKVTLKNGVSLVGELKKLDATNSLTISVGGVESEILMSDVESIEPIAEKEEQANNVSDPFTMLPPDMYGNYIITDNGEYPEQFEITVGNQKFTLVLVRGGLFNMGYDGSKSLFMDTEPIHKVMLSSFYVSKEFLSFETAYTLLNQKYTGKEGTVFRTRDWDRADRAVKAIAEQEGAPYRLLTEAEWEYCAILPIADTVFEEIIASKPYKKKSYVGEWCNDFWGEYKSQNQINPQGPPTGKKHVARSFSPTKYKWNRDPKKVNSDNTNRYYVRFAISADQIIDKIK